MALSIGNITTNVGVKTATSVTFSHNSNGNVLLFSQYVRYSDGNTQATGVTYNGVAMTQKSVIGTGADSLSVWELLNPAAGANNLVMTFAGVEGAMVLKCVSVVDAHATTPTGTYAQASGSSTAPSVAVTSAAGELVVDFVGHSYLSGAATLTVGAGQTEISNVESGATGLYGRGASSTEAGAASVTMSWTASVSAAWRTIGVSLVPPAAASDVFIVGPQRMGRGIGSVTAARIGGVLEY